MNDTIIQHPKIQPPQDLKMRIQCSIKDNSNFVINERIVFDKKKDNIYIVNNKYLIDKGLYDPLKQEFAISNEELADFLTSVIKIRRFFGEDDQGKMLLIPHDQLENMLHNTVIQIIKIEVSDSKNNEDNYKTAYPESAVFTNIDPYYSYQ